MEKFVQIKNPRSGRYIKIDREKGLIVGHKGTLLPYRNIIIIK